jgi:hypothetical protein
MQRDSLYPGPSADIVSFLEAQQPAIADLVETAFLTIGGHYAQMTTTERHQQAQSDAGEIVTQICTGDVNQRAIDASIQSIASMAILSDVVRMSEVVERLIIAHVQQQLASDPELGRKVISRITNTSRRFRMNITAAYAERVRVQIDHPPSR